MTQSIRVLHLEDDPRDAEIISESLAREKIICDVLVASGRESFERALQSETFDLIFCDYNVPGYDGKAALELIQRLYPTIPVIVISGGVSEYEAVDCLHLGATDYVLKQSLVRLPSAVRRALTQAKDNRLREEAENRFRSLLESAPDAMVIVGPGGFINLVNSQAESLFGYESSELLGQPVEVLVPERYRLIHSHLVKSFITSGEPRKLALPTELYGLRKDGVEIPLEILLSPLRQADETLTIAGIRDLTERRKLETQLSRVQRMDSIGAFAGNIAHDLNNALAPVLMSLELLRIQNPQSSELIDTIETCAKHGAELLRQLLVFSKGSYVEPKRLDPRTLLADTARYLQLTIPKNIEFESRIPDVLPAIWGDSAQLHQVLVNLCVNARDAMPDGGRLSLDAEVITVDGNYARIVPEASIGKYLMLRVSDTGVGMSQEVLDRIFEPFYSTKSRGKGTGLGLSIVSGIVKSHFGFVRAYSTPSHGSTIAVYLPIDTELPSEESLPAQAGPELEGGGDLILIIDDSEGVRTTAAAVLSALNFRVKAVDAAKEALEIVSQQPNEVRAVITDLHMPEMDGHELVAELTKVAPHLDVIVTSGNFGAGKVQALRDLGVRAFLEKPFTQQMLTDALRNVVQR